MMNALLGASLAIVLVSLQAPEHPTSLTLRAIVLGAASELSEDNPWRRMESEFVSTISRSSPAEATELIGKRTVMEFGILCGQISNQANAKANAASKGLSPNESPETIERKVSQALSPGLKSLVLACDRFGREVERHDVEQGNSAAHLVERAENSVSVLGLSVALPTSHALGLLACFAFIVHCLLWSNVHTMKQIAVQPLPQDWIFWHEGAIGVAIGLAWLATPSLALMSVPAVTSEAYWSAALGPGAQNWIVVVSALLGVAMAAMAARVVWTAISLRSLLPDHPATAPAHSDEP